MDATRWRRERQVKKLIRRQPIDLILDARLVTQIDGVDPVGHPDVERTRWLAEACGAGSGQLPVFVECPGILGALTRAYRETDQPDANDAVGKTLVERDVAKRGPERRFYPEAGAHVWWPAAQSACASAGCIGAR